MSTSVMLENIWNDFTKARKERDVERMKLCLKEFDLEYDSTKADLSRYAPQKQMARRGAMVKSISRIPPELEYGKEAGDW